MKYRGRKEECPAEPTETGHVCVGGGEKEEQIPSRRGRESDIDRCPSGGEEKDILLFVVREVSHSLCLKETTTLYIPKVTRVCIFLGVKCITLMFQRVALKADLETVVSCTGVGHLRF